MASECPTSAKTIRRTRYYYNKRTGLEMHNLYTMLYHKATYEAVAENSGHRGLINARSGTAGMQRYPICWSGDPKCEWEEMASTLRGGLCIGLSGVPFWSNDTAGYTLSTADLTPELYIRWMQMAMFQSHMRFNGSPLRAPWAFGDRAVENYRKYAKLRYRLLPYIYSHAYNATKTGLPMMRAMVLEFQDDPSTHNIQDQYMFGDAFLVAPVYTPVNKRTVYLPEGTWYDYETGTEYHRPEVFAHRDLLWKCCRSMCGRTRSFPWDRKWSTSARNPSIPLLSTSGCRLRQSARCTTMTSVAHTEEIVKCRARKNGSEITLNVGAFGQDFRCEVQQDKPPETSNRKRQGGTTSRVAAGA